MDEKVLGWVKLRVALADASDAAAECGEASIEELLVATERHIIRKILRNEEAASEAEVYLDQKAAPQSTNNV